VRQKDCTFQPLATSAAPVIPDGFGVNIDFTDPQPGELKLMAEAGLRWVRMDLKWDATEKQPGVYDFSAYDRLMTALEPFSLRALFILDYGNPLYDNGAPPRTEAARQAFARWAVAAAKHFAGRGAIWEVYNEPNHSLFWPPRPNAQEYVALALAVGKAFREAVPDEKLIGPAISEIDFDFLESCFKAGLLEYWSAVSIHPYRRNDPETAAADYCRLREMIKTYSSLSSVQSPMSNVQSPVGTGSISERSPVRTGGFTDQITGTKDIQIISSEWGYSSVWRGLSDDKQGQLLARVWLTNAANDISLSIWYDWRDDGPDPKEPEHHFGLVSNPYHQGREPVYDPKPTYLAVKTLTTFFNGYRFAERLSVGDAQDYVLAFRKGNELRFAVWTTASGAREVLIPLSGGRYATARHTGEDLGAVTAGAKGLTITLTSAPIYIR
jgi:hypothetical protein